LFLDLIDEGVRDDGWETEAVGEFGPRTRRERGMMICDSSDGAEELELDES